MNQWLTGVGTNMEWLTASATIAPGVQYATALLCSLIASTILRIAIQATCEQTVRRGVLIWIGFIATSRAEQYLFKVRTLEIFAIHTGYSLIDLMLIGAIVGEWRKRSATLAARILNVD